MNMDLKQIFTYDDSTGYKYQAVTADAASQADPLDLGAEGKQMFSGKAPVYLNIVTYAGFTTGDGMTSIEIALETDTSSAFATAKKQVALFNIVLADLAVAGKVLVSQILPRQAWQRYMRLYFNVIDGTGSAGSFIAWLSDMPLDQSSQIDLVGA